MKPKIISYWQMSLVLIIGKKNRRNQVSKTSFQNFFDITFMDSVIKGNGIMPKWRKFQTLFYLDTNLQKLQDLKVPWQ